MNKLLICATAATLLTLLVSAGCAESSGGGSTNGIDRPPPCYGKCEGFSEGAYMSPYEANMTALNLAFPGEPMTKIEDAYSVHMKLGEVEYAAPTHLFGGYINLIPYADEDGAAYADETIMERRDEIIAKVFQPGEISYLIKHHRPSFRTLGMGGGAAELKENIKLQDSHIGILVGVERDGKPGAMTVNNPQAYQNGLFGEADYPMIFLRPVLPDYVPSSVQTQVIDNIRTMMIGFNSVSFFPRAYNGGDPLAANTLEKLKTHVEMMVKTIAGDDAAYEFFKDPKNLIYCAELAHVASSAGLHFPLNDATMVPMVGQEVWDKFKAEVALHNAGEASLFTTLNDNDKINLVKLALAPEELLAVPEYAPESSRDSERAKLAFKPMTMADTIEHFLRTHIPREQMGESVAPLQAAVLEAMLPGILEATAMNLLPPTDPRRVAVETVYGQIVEIVRKSYGSYAEFRTALEPGLAAARAISGPREGDDSGNALFVPPSLLHIVAQGKHKGGLLELKYEGHGIHASHVQRKPDPSQPPELPEPVVVEPTEPFAGTCISSCGGFSPDVECACDDMCATYEDCCDDYEEHCGDQS